MITLTVAPSASSVAICDDDGSTVATLTLDPGVYQLPGVVYGGQPQSVGQYLVTPLGLQRLAPYSAAQLDTFPYVAWFTFLLALLIGRFRVV